MNQLRELKADARKGQHTSLNHEKLRMLLATVRAATAGVAPQLPPALGDVARRHFAGAAEIVNEVRLRARRCAGSVCRRCCDTCPQGFDRLGYHGWLDGSACS
jgi:hypothetical protein